VKFCYARRDFTLCRCNGWPKKTQNTEVGDRVASGSTSNEGKPTGTLGNLGQRASRGCTVDLHGWRLTLHAGGQSSTTGHTAPTVVEDRERDGVCRRKGAGVGDQSCMFT
jgi:hypothetical protein